MEKLENIEVEELLKRIDSDLKSTYLQRFKMIDILNLFICKSSYMK